jgi:hypothetical protein
MKRPSIKSVHTAQAGLWAQPHEVPSHCRTGYPFWVVRWPSGVIIGSFRNPFDACICRAHAWATSEQDGCSDYRATISEEY